MKKVLIAIGLAMMIFLSGCTVSDYLQGKVPDGDKLTTEDEVDEDIDALMKELTEEETGEEPELDEDLEEFTEEPTGGIDLPTEDDETFVKLQVKESDLVKLKLNTADADEDDLSYTFTEPLDAQGEWQTNYGDAGNYLVTVTVNDGQLTTTKKVLLVVERVNVAPVIEGVDDKIDMDEGDTLRLNPKITDPNGDLVTVTISDPLGNDGVWETNYTDRGSYNIVITATDGELETTQEISLLVNKYNLPPIVDGVEDVTIEEGDTIVVSPIVSDPNQDEVTLTISDPLGDDGEWATGFTDHGEYEITVEATDGEAVTTETFVLSVEDINKAPEILDVQLA